jgi:hypothetical protein
MKKETVNTAIRSFQKVCCLLALIVPMVTSDAADSNKVKPHLLSDKKTYDTQVSMCRAEDGTLWAAWVGYEFPYGDRLLVASEKKEQWSAPEALSTNHTQIVRPTICSSGNSIWVFWTQSGEELSGVVGARRENGKWSAQELINTAGVAAQNQEVVADKNGDIAVVWQEFHKTQYDIVMRRFSEGKWRDSVSVTDDKFDDWDPAVIRDSNGKLFVAWTSFRDGDYDLYIRQMDKKSDAIRLSARGEYDLHAALAADKEGNVWVAWDSVTIPRHGSSGGSTITGANKKKDGEVEMNDPENPDQKPLVAQIRIVCLNAGKIQHIPKTSKALTPPAPYKLAHTAMPKISIDDNGTLWVGYRGLMVDSKGETKTKEQLSKMTPAQRRNAARTARRGPYWWDVFVQSFNGGNWSQPKKLPTSDGTLEEVAIAPAGKGVEIAWQMEHRKENAANAPAETTDHGDHHHDYPKALGSNGDIYVAHFSTGSGEVAAKALVARKAPLDKDVKPRLPREQAHYETTVNGTKYQLLWGDMHKHSNISRCSTGNEPSPEEHYKYAYDVCQYDFVAMSDHAEHSSSFNWWRIQKLADLYNIPGFFSVLYGYEWSAGFPIGHHNVVFWKRPSPILRSNLDETRTRAGLWEALSQANKEALTVPHTVADKRMGRTWEDHDDRYARVVEIFQACRGSYEYDGCPRQHVEAKAKGSFYQDALAKGYKMGIICSTDHGWGTAYAVVYGTENSREAAFKGIQDRRCYGSTTYGLIVDFRVGKHFMGEEFSADKPEEISVYTRGTVPIRQIDILSGGKVVHSMGDVKNPIGKKEVKLKWTPESLPKGTTYYYARVIQEDDEMAWASPVWVTKRD